MKLKIYRVYTNTLDEHDPERVVTTNRSRYTQHWWTVKVRAVFHAGMIEAWRVGLDRELERMRRHGSEQQAAP